MIAHGNFRFVSHELIQDTAGCFSFFWIALIILSNIMELGTTFPQQMAFSRPYLFQTFPVGWTDKTNTQDLDSIQLPRL